MTNNWRACLMSLMLLTQTLCAGDDTCQQVRLREVDTLFANPGEGLMSQHSSSSVVYLRFNWADVEPEEGKYNWEYIDDAIAGCKPRGGTVGMRVMTANAHTPGYYCSPEWVFDLGCKGYEYTVGGGDRTSGGRRIPRIEPDYSDPIYLTKQADFISALGKRYDGSPNVEFIDIGSYGIWGEWHSSHPVSIAIRKEIVDMYLHAFHKTPLVGMVDDAQALAYTLAHGGGYRCDGIGSPVIQSRWSPEPNLKDPFYSPDTLQAIRSAWTNAPVIFEWYGNYNYLKSRGWSFNAAVNFMLSNHVCMINDNIGNVPLEAMPQFERLQRLAGYRFVLREMTHELSVPPGGRLNVKMKWANVGVGKLYHTYKLQMSLRNSFGHTVVTTVTGADPREWLPGERDISAQMTIPSSLPKGKYGLAVAIADKTSQRPPLHLAMDAPAKNGWYLVSQIIVE